MDSDQRWEKIKRESISMKKLFLMIFNIFLSTQCAFATNWCNDANMKGAWKMDEASGSVADCTSNGNNGTNTSGTQGVTGKFSNGISYPQVNNQKLSIPASTSLNNVTVLSTGLWANNTSFGATDGIASDRGCLIGKGYRSGALYFKLTNQVRWVEHWPGGTAQWDTTGGNAVTGTWQHYAVTYDRSSTANNPTIYIDGTSQANSQTGTAPCCGGRDDDSVNALILAQDGNDLAELNSTIDEGFWYSGILTSTQINDIKDNGLAGAAAINVDIIRGGSLLQGGSKIL